MAVVLLSRWHSPRHTANEPISQRYFYFFHLVYCSSRLVEATTEFTFDLQLPTPLPTLEPQLCPSMGTAGSARESTHTKGDDSSSNVDENGSVSKRLRKTFHGVCPLCWVTKEISHSANYRAVVIARHADLDTCTLFESQDVNSLFDSFRICKQCSSSVLQASKFLCATSSSSKKYLSSIMQMKTKQPAKILQTAFASQGQPLVELFNSIASGQCSVTFNFSDETVAPAPRENLYAVGDSVVLPRRKHAGVNEDAGVGQVLSFWSTQLGGKRVVFYSVKHNIGHRVLNDMPENLLQPYSVDDESSRKRRSVDAEAQASVRAQERESDRLTKDMTRLEERNHNLEAEATRTKLEMEELRAEFKASKRVAYDLGKKNEELSVKMTAQFELMQKNIVDLLAEVKSESESEAASAGNREREERSELIREQQKKHAQEVKALQSAVRDATAARPRLEGAVASMLEDTAKTAVVEVEGQVAELCAAAAENEKVADKAFIGLLERIC